MWNQPDQDIATGVKDQATGTSKIAHFIDLGGGGELVELMKKSNRTKNYTELEERITHGLRPFLYNNGEGKMFPVKELVMMRMRAKGIHIEDANVDGGQMKQSKMSRLWCCIKKQLSRDAEMKNNNNARDVKLKDMESMQTVEGNLPTDQQEKLVCWKMDERGAAGETPLHICLLNATSVHADLAKWLLKVWPKLIYDIYVGDEFYGENVLHMAIVNEDPAMVKFLLDHKPDLNQRACGNFFTPDDQKGLKKEVLDHEWYDLPVKSNYEGFTYWGGYALGFAACLGQEECVRLLVAKGADPNVTDANGNTALHCIVVHDEKMVDRMTTGKEMFDLLVSFGAKLHIKNRQGLTPLTLAASLGRKDIYEHILELDREVYWIYGNVTCAGYPLENIDTISEMGEINTNSCMYHIVYGGERSHLGMIDGIIEHLLHEKWKTFAKYRFFRRFAIFVAYFIIFVSAFYLRPGTDKYSVVKTEWRNDTNGSYKVNVTVKNPCYLLVNNNNEDMARLILEGMTLFGATVGVFLSLKEIYHQGYGIFFQTLSASPAKALFLLANLFVILMVPGRAACSFEYEDVMGVLAILCTAPYFLFFCRGFRIVGPFVVMIYQMIRTDLLRFFTIYLIFVVGFSQAMYVIFRGWKTNIFDDPIESIMGMFIMSLGEFADIYESFSGTLYPFVPTLIFMVYMILVTLLLINMLIAMMGNTYQMVNETQKEWLRQWAKIILVVEQTVTTELRKQQQINYSRRMNDGRRALMIRWHHSEKEAEELKKHREEEKQAEESLMRKKQEQTLIQKAKQLQSPRKILVQDSPAMNDPSGVAQKQLSVFQNTENQLKHVNGKKLQ